MREIKFRGKRKDNEEWVYGYLFKILDKCYILWGTTNDVPNMIEVISETVGQYTELKDKNEKEIYERDIITYYDDTYKVEFKGDRGGYFPFAQGDGCGCCQCEVVTFPNDCEILGNIYDNPEY